MRVRAIRGAITVTENSRDEILVATRILLEEIMDSNSLTEQELISVIFSMTPDLNRVFPAQAARQMGWIDVPLFCTQEIAVTGALPRCIRVLVHAHSEKERGEIHHIYLREARRLRPDLG